MHTLLAPANRKKTVENSVEFGNTVVSVLLDGEDTAGQFSMLEIVGRPGTEPPYHVHQNEDETFYILEGRISFMVDGVVYDLVAGDTMFLPRNVPHTFRVRSEHARGILTVTPSGFDGYFRAIGRPVDSLDTPKPAPPPPDIHERMAKISAQFGVRMMDQQPEF